MPLHIWSPAFGDIALPCTLDHVFCLVAAVAGNNTVRRKDSNISANRYRPSCGCCLACSAFGLVLGWSGCAPKWGTDPFDSLTDHSSPCRGKASGAKNVRANPYGTEAKHAAIPPPSLITWSFPLSVGALQIRPAHCSVRVWAGVIGRQLRAVLISRTTCTSPAVS